MDFVGFVSYLRQFNADVLVFGALAWGVTLLLKKTLLKNAGAKLLTLLPFALGAVLYAAYGLALQLAGCAEGDGVFSEAITCGALATALQAILIRFTGADADMSVQAACVKSLLAGYVTLSAKEAEALAAAVASDETQAKALLTGYVGDAAETYYLLLSQMLKTLEGEQ